MASDFCIDIIDPNNPTGSKIQAVIPHRLILRYYKYFPVRYENLRAAKHVLDNPRRIFSGVRQFNEGGWCFTGRPAVWYVKMDVCVSFPENLVFSVYLNSRMYVYESRAENAAVDDSLCPEGWEDRYGALIWKSTS